MNDKVIGIVLSVSQYREHDSLLTVLTKSGLMTLVAKGMNKNTSKNAHFCMMFAHSEFIIDYVSDKTMFTLKSGTLINGYRHLSDDLQTIAIATFMAETSKVLCDDDPQAFLHLLTFMYERLLPTSDKLLLLALFLSTCSQLIGFSPMVDECVACGDVKISSISIDEGGFICENCRKELMEKNVDVILLKRFRLINKATLEHVDILKNYGPWSMADCMLCKDFLFYHSGIQVSSWEFLLTCV